MSAPIGPERRIDPDGAPVDVFALPTGGASLERLLRGLFAEHWQDDTFGPLIQGAAWEMKTVQAPDRIGMMDGYLTIAFGAPHFHICIGEHKGTRANPVSQELARHRRTARAELYRRISRDGTPVSWGLRLFNGKGEQQITVLLPNPFLDGDDKILRTPDLRLDLWDRQRANGSASPNLTRSIVPARVSAATDRFHQRSINVPYLTSAFSAGWRRHLWLALLIAGSLAFSLGFACAVPFAAFAAVSAMTLPRRDALLLAVVLWLINQVIGFAVLHYPWDGTTLAWGAILGGIAVLSTAVAHATMLGQGLVVTTATSFAAAFVVYEGGLYLISALLMGGTEDFAAAIVVRILEINAAAYVALLAAALLAAMGLRAAVLGRAATPSLSR